MTSFDIGVCLLSVSSGFDGIQEQNICNKIMAKFIQNYSTIFESDMGKGDLMQETEPANVIIVKVRVCQDHVYNLCSFLLFADNTYK